MTDRGVTDDRDGNDSRGGLFETATDAVAVLGFDGDVPTVVGVNGAFEEAFGHAPVDEPLESLEWLPKEVSRAVERPGETTPAERFETSLSGDRRVCGSVVPMSGHEYSHLLVFTDVAADDGRVVARERSRIPALLETTSELADTETATEAYDLTVRTVERAFAYDAATLVVDGDAVAQSDDAPPLDGDVLDAVQSSGRPVRRTDVRAAEGGPRWAVVVTVPVADRGGLAMATRAGGDVDATHTVGRPGTAEELLGRRLGETLRRLDRERRLREERERLALLHRLLRHNLLNGLNLVRARTELLDEHLPADDPATTHLRTIAVRTDDMIDRLESVRSFTKTAVDDRATDLGPVDLGATLTAELETLREVYPQATVSVRGSIPDVEVRADELLCEVFENLLTNAVEHNDSPSPSVTVAVSANDATVSVRVLDDGPGIPDDEKRSVFLENRSTADPRKGVGLVLVNELVSTYGGDVSVADRRNTPGSVFTVELPRA